MHRLLICTDCRGGDRTEALIARLAAALPAFQVAGTGCMAGCTRPGTIAFTSDGKASYLFGDVNHDAPTGDIEAFARAYLAQPDGWITDARPFGRLRHAALARIPVGPTP